MVEERKLVPIEAIEAGLNAVEQKNERDDNDRREERDLAWRQKKAEIGSIEQLNADRSANRRLRFLYAKAVYRYLCFYTAGSAALLVANALKPFNFVIPETTLTTIVGSTAVAAIGLVGFVVSGLFKNPG